MRWFNSDRAKFIEYTLLIAVTSTAVSFYVFDERKEKLFQAEKETLKTEKEALKGEIQTYKEKILSLQEEREIYLRWLEKDDGTFPALVSVNNRLLKEIEVANRTLENAQKDTSEKSDYLYLNAAEIKVGSSYVDPKTTVIFGVRTIHADRTAEVGVRLPGKSTERVRVAPADHWEFKLNGVGYLVTVREVNFISDYLRITVQQIP